MVLGVGSLELRPAVSCLLLSDHFLAGTWLSALRVELKGLMSGGASAINLAFSLARTSTLRPKTETHLTKVTTLQPFFSAVRHLCGAAGTTRSALSACQPHRPGLRPTTQTSRPNQRDMNSLKVGFLLAVLVVLCPFAMWGQTNAVKTILGQHNISGLLDGQGTLAKFNNPASVVFNNTGSVPTVMYVADKDNNAIRAVVLATNQVTTIAGSGIAGWADGTGVNARFNAPSGIAIDKDNSYLYVADSINGAIRKINIASGTVTTIIGKSCSSGPTIDNAQASNGGCYSTGDFMNGYIPGSGTAPLLHSQSI